jgi:hypothetical protein
MRPRAPAPAPLRPAPAAPAPVPLPRAGSGAQTLSLGVFVRLSLAARLLAALAPGYLHPDELFQSQEVVASALLGVAGNIPWEFAGCSTPHRSIVPP